MSKRDVTVLCTLAAHLALTYEAHAERAYNFVPYASATSCAADAMKLQRLGRRARNNETKRCNVRDYYSEENHGCKYNGEAARISAILRDILGPYGLRGYAGGDPRGYCLHIIGLPGNTLGGDGEGFGI